MRTKIQYIGLIYLLLEIFIIALGMIDYYYQKEDTFLLKDLENHYVFSVVLEFLLELFF